MKLERDTYKNLMWEVAQLVGFKKGDHPSRSQLMGRLKASLGGAVQSTSSPVGSNSSAASSASTIKMVLKPTPGLKPLSDAERRANQERDIAHFKKAAEAKRLIAEEKVMEIKAAAKRRFAPALPAPPPPPAPPSSLVETESAPAGVLPNSEMGKFFESDDDSDDEPAAKRLKAETPV
jgi:hypothetical protein